ncbi:hypothetical protein [Geodermatophilus sp. URMC 64]
MTRKRAVVPVLAVAATLLVGCDQTAWLDEVARAAMPTDAPGLAALLREGIAALRSAHVDLEATAAGATITGSGDETLDDGRTETLDLTQTIPGAGDIRVVLVDGETYVQLPEAVNPSDKPWLLISSTSGNAAVRRLAASLDSLTQSSNLDQYATFTEAATLEVVGEEEVAGVVATHYALTVDVLQLPNDIPGRRDLLSAGVVRLPVQLWVDVEGRPVQAGQELTVQGQDVATVVTFSEFDEPVRISAPPADQVATA